MDRTYIDRLEKLPGKIGFYYKDLTTSEVFSHNHDESFLAASVIKLFIMAEVVRQCEVGILSKDDIVKIDKSRCVPSCGALTYMHDGLEVTIEDLYTLMIIFSDNSATNFLIDIVGFDAVNNLIRDYDYNGILLNRKMFDYESASQGIQNFISPIGVAKFLEDLYEGRLVSAYASKHMLDVLGKQKLNSKIPFLLRDLEDSGQIAHKTGEDDGITHDVGVIFAKKPFILVFLGNETDVVKYDKEMAELAYLLYIKQNK
ncbi:MAG: serine hydrolase [Lachnospiraceae bacterium]